MSYILPTSTTEYPNGLTLTQFIQTVLTGISGIAGNLVRPKWQIEPAKQPEITTNWISFGVQISTPDANAYTANTANNNYVSQRHDNLEITIDILGPSAIENAELIRDGFYIPQNLEALQLANMGLIEVGPFTHLPDFINERYVNRVNMSLFLRREIQRVYSVPTIVSASGTIYVPDIRVDYSKDWEA